MMKVLIESVDGVYTGREYPREDFADCVRAHMHHHIRPRRNRAARLMYIPVECISACNRRQFFLALSMKYF